MIYHIFIFVVNITAMLLAHGNKFKSVNSNTANTITTVRTNGIKTASFQLQKLTDGYKPALIINTDGVSGFLHLVLIDKNTNAVTKKCLNVFQQGCGTITYSYNKDTGVLTLTSTALIYGGITCICGIG